LAADCHSSIQVGTTFFPAHLSEHGFSRKKTDTQMANAPSSNTRIRRAATSPAIAAMRTSNLTLSFVTAALVWTLLCIWPVSGAAQDLTPRAYWPSPKGTRVAVLGYSRAEGDVLFDPSIPLYGVDSELNVAILAYMQTLGLWGRTANLIVELPYQWGTTQGFIGTTPAGRRYDGIGDLGVTLSVNLVGAPSMSVEDFQAMRADPRHLLGASLKVIAPTGKYDSDRILNIGANRWSAKAELGYMFPIRNKVIFEMNLGAWFFGNDDSFIGGRRRQHPIVAAKLHLVRRFSPGFWASLDATYFEGGRQIIGGNELGDVQQNARLGATISVPIRGRHSVKIGYAAGVVTEFGTDFNQFLVTYQVLLN
jgi:hypothetical protein